LQENITFVRENVEKGISTSRNEAHRLFYLCCSQPFIGASAAPGDEPFILQQQRQQALETQLTPQAPDVRLQSPATRNESGDFAETPCFTIMT
jgi:hemolysin activation/secretion protein